MTSYPQKPIYALDLGTTKFCIARINFSSALEYPQIETVSVKAQGMRRGMLSNLTEARSALMILVEKAEDQFQTNIDQVAVGIAGSHLSYIISTAEMKLTTKKITSEDLLKLEKKIDKNNEMESRCQIESIPLYYSLDHAKKIEKPLGFESSHIQGSYFEVLGDKRYIKSIITLCNSVGLEICKLYSEPFASAAVNALDLQRQHGVVIADIGGGTTDCIAFFQGKPIQLFTINIGGILMTNDIAIGLGIPFEAAEQLKLQYGLNNNDLSSVKIRNIHNKLISVDMSLFHKILDARISELANLMARHIKPSQTSLRAGIILTGGGAEVQGIADKFSALLQIDTKISKPSKFIKNVFHSCEQSNQLSCKYSTILGALYLEYRRLEKEKKNLKIGPLEKIFQNMWGWIRELSQ